MLTLPEEGCHTIQGHRRSAGFGQEERVMRKRGPEPLSCFLWERQDRAGESDVGLAGLNKSGGLGGIRAVLHCLVPGPELI